MDLFEKCRTHRLGDEMKASGCYPYFRVVESAQEPEILSGGRRMIMLGSNNYLGLATHPRVKRAATRALDRYGAGCSGSRVLNGTLDLHVELEERLARFFRREAALSFTSGYLANLGVISALCGRDDVVVVDRLAHASIFDACHLARTQVRRFRHNNPESLDAVLSELGPRAALVAVDGVYSMTGDVAPLPDLLAVCRRHGARLLVDDAHGLGVMGASGRGTAEHFGLEGEIDVIVGTTSKAVPGVGGFVVADEAVVQYIKHASRPLIFAASAPPSALASVLAGLQVIDDEPGLRERLWANTRKMQRGFRALGFDMGGSETPIIPVHTGDLSRAFVMYQALSEAGVFVNPVMPPACTPNACLVRTSYMATHTEAQLDRVLVAFERAASLAGPAAAPLQRAG